MKKFFKWLVSLQSDSEKKEILWIIALILVVLLVVVCVMDWGLRFW